MNITTQTTIAELTNVDDALGAMNLIAETFDFTYQVHTPDLIRQEIDAIAAHMRTGGAQGRADQLLGAKEQIVKTVVGTEGWASLILDSLGGDGLDERLQELVDQVIDQLVPEGARQPEVVEVPPVHTAGEALEAISMLARRFGVERHSRAVWALNEVIDEHVAGSEHEEAAGDLIRHAVLPSSEWEAATAGGGDLPHEVLVKLVAEAAENVL